MLIKVNLTLCLADSHGTPRLDGHLFLLDCSQFKRAIMLKPEPGEVQDPSSIFTFKKEKTRGPACRQYRCSLSRWEGCGG